jgi:hypothetical protein
VYFREWYFFLCQLHILLLKKKMFGFNIVGERSFLASKKMVIVKDNIAVDRKTDSNASLFGGVATISEYTAGSASACRWHVLCTDL